MPGCVRNGLRSAGLAPEALAAWRWDLGSQSWAVVGRGHHGLVRSPEAVPGQG